MQDNDEVINDIPLYWSAPYQSSIIADVIEVHDNFIRLNQTIFYPGGGGQPHDVGTIDCEGKEYRVTEVFKRDGVVWHKININKNEAEQIVSKQVLLKIDWERRYSLMKAHTAQHLFSHFIQQLYNCTTLKANFEPSTIDIEIEKQLSPEEIIRALEYANKWISNGSKVESIVVDQEKYNVEYKSRTRGKVSKEPIVRLVHIVGIQDLVCCGGTHLHDINEINSLYLLEIKKNKVKLAVDLKAINSANSERYLMIQLEKITEKKNTKLIEMITSKLEENKRLSQATSEALRLAFENITNQTEVINDHSIACLTLPSVNRDQLRTAIESVPDNTFIGLLGYDNTLYLISKDSRLLAADIANVFREKFSQKGGGNKSFAQIKIEGIEKPLELLKEIIKSL